MHDWEQLVRENFARKLPVHEQDELVRELASHLEEVYDELLSNGMPKGVAFERCLEQLTAATRMAGSIQRAKHKEGAMNYRSKALWLPGLVTLTISSTLLMVVELFAFSRPTVHGVDDSAVVLSGVWLLTLPFCGALGAYMSQRAGGTCLISLAAATFPAAVTLALFCFILPIGIFIERNTFILHHPLSLGLGVLNWIVVPGIALLLGGVAVYKRDTRRNGTVSSVTVNQN